MKRLILVLLIGLFLIVGVFLSGSCCGIEEPSVSPGKTAPNEVEESPVAPGETIPSKKNILSLGESALVSNDNILFTVVRYKLSDSIFCDSTFWKKTDYPDDWATFLWVYFRAENIGEFPEYPPGRLYLDLFYKERECNTYPVYFCHNINYYDVSYLTPGEWGEGWRIYKVPRELDISKVKICVTDPWCIRTYWKLTP